MAANQKSKQGGDASKVAPAQGQPGHGKSKSSAGGKSTERQAQGKGAVVTPSKRAADGRSRSK